MDTNFTDFEKAFDSVDHLLLINKLKCFGFRDPLLYWLTSFLTNRTQIAKFKNYLSKPINVISDIPQGNIPFVNFIFIIYKRYSISHETLKYFII
jgi:hypothetical protein